MFKTLIGVSLEEMLLDPDNPRFATGFKPKAVVNDIEAVQDAIINHFERKDTAVGDEEEDSGDLEERYGVSNLIKSIRTIGFVAIDKPVVARIPGSKKYRVVEGNRRITACKIILRKHKEEVAKGRSPDPDREYPVHESVLKSILNIDVLEIDCDGLTEEEIKKRERIVLGVRHHGSLLEWDALPKAYSIFKEYMEYDPPLAEFEWNAKRAKHVQDVFTLGNESPKRALRSYVCFKRIKDSRIAIQPHHFSLLQELVTSGKLTSPSGYITMDAKRFELSEDSVTKIDELCQFEARDGMKQTKEDFKILNDPKSVRHLGSLVAARRDSDQAVAQFATSLLEQVENRDRPLEPIEDHPLQSASGELLAFKSRRRWVEELERLLDRLDSDESLDLSEFGPTNDVLKLEELNETMGLFRAVYGIGNK